MPEVNRQQVRREIFQASFERMPLWETWVEGERSNYRSIPRRKRREMARALAKRTFQQRRAA